MIMWNVQIWHIHGLQKYTMSLLSLKTLWTDKLSSFCSSSQIFGPIYFLGPSPTWFNWCIRVCLTFSSVQLHGNRQGGVTYYITPQLTTFLSLYVVWARQCGNGGTFWHILLDRLQWFDLQEHEVERKTLTVNQPCSEALRQSLFRLETRVFGPEEPFHSSKNPSFSLYPPCKNWEQS